MRPGYLLKYYAAVALIALAFSGCRPLLVMNTSSASINTGNPTSVDSSILEMVAPYREQLEESMDVVVAVLEEDLVKEQPEGSLGNHVAEVTFWAASANYDKEIDFAIMNYGGLRVPYVNAGDLKIRDAYQIMPFDNNVVIMEVDGATVLELAGRMAANGGWPVHNMTYVIDGSNAVGVFIAGNAVAPESKYLMALSDYLADGGDQLEFLKEFDYYNTGILVRDAIIDFWRKAAGEGRSISAITDGRVQIK